MVHYRKITKSIKHVIQIMYMVYGQSNTMQEIRQAILTKRRFILDYIAPAGLGLSRWTQFLVMTSENSSLNPSARDLRPFYRPNSPSLLD